MSNPEDAADARWSASGATGDHTLVGVRAVITRADGSQEWWPLDLDAYRDGRFEPAPTLANGDSLAIVTEHA